MTVTATLVTDGSSDIVLLPILRWLLRELTFEPVELCWGDLRQLPSPPKALRERLQRAVDLYPCQLLLVHRDAEDRPPQERFDEIARANATKRPHICVVPVHMQETWLLLDEHALRQAAGRPSGTNDLALPPIKRWESLPDPKSVLHQALIAASGAKGRRAKRFSPSIAAHRLADLVDDWSPLRALSAFQRLETDTRAALTALGVPLCPGPATGRT